MVEEATVLVVVRRSIDSKHEEQGKLADPVRRFEPVVVNFYFAICRDYCPFSATEIFDRRTISIKWSIERKLGSSGL